MDSFDQRFNNNISLDSKLPLFYSCLFRQFILKPFWGDMKISPAKEWGGGHTAIPSLELLLSSLIT